MRFLLPSSSFLLQMGTLAMVAPGSAYPSQRCVWGIAPRDLPDTCSVVVQFTMIDLDPVHVGVGSDFVYVRAPAYPPTHPPHIVLIPCFHGPSSGRDFDPFSA